VRRAFTSLQVTAPRERAAGSPYATSGGVLQHAQLPTCPPREGGGRSAVAARQGAVACVRTRRNRCSGQKFGWICHKATPVECMVLYTRFGVLKTSTEENPLFLQPICDAEPALMTGTPPREHEALL
jgi:hypothetical protein